MNEGIPTRDEFEEDHVRMLDLLVSRGLIAGHGQTAEFTSVAWTPAGVEFKSQLRHWLETAGLSESLNARDIVSLIGVVFFLERFQC